MAWKILALVFAAAAGTFLPNFGTNEVECFYIQTVEVLITTLLLIFIWSAFQLVRPARSKRDWTLIGLVTVPMLWVALVVRLALFVNHSQDEWHRVAESLTISRR